MTKLFGTGNFSEFAERKQLAADKTLFCIEGVKLFTQKDGKERWYCTILVPREEKVVVETLTFDRSASRDTGFQRLLDADAFPLHNCSVVKREFKGKKSGMMQTFYELEQDEKALTCPCGGLGLEPEPEPDSVGVPF